MNRQVILTHKPVLNFIKDYSYDTVEIYTQKPELGYTLYTGLDDRVFGEFSLWKFLFENMKEDDWISFNHYRRQFLPVYHKISVAEPIYFRTNIAEQISLLHSDLSRIMIEEVLNPVENELFHKINYINPYNIFYTDYYTLRDWIQYIEPKLNFLMNKYNIFDYNSAVEFVKRNEKHYLRGHDYKNKSIEYQSRLFAFILERLNTLFWINRDKYICRVNLLEEGQKI